MPLSAGKIERRETELSLGSYDSAVEDAQNPNPKLDELLKLQKANSMPPPKTSPKRPLEGPRHSPSPKKVAVEAPAEMAKDSPRAKGSQSEGSPGPSLSERSTPVPAPAPKAAKSGKSPTYWRPDLGYVSGDLTVQLLKLPIECCRLRRYFEPKACGALKCSPEALALYKTENGRIFAA